MMKLSEKLRATPIVALLIMVVNCISGGLRFVKHWPDKKGGSNGGWSTVQYI